VKQNFSRNEKTSKITGQKEDGLGPSTKGERVRKKRQRTTRRGTRKEKKNEEDVNRRKK